MATKTKCYWQVPRYGWMSQGQAKFQRRCQKKYQERLKYLKILKYNLEISPIWKIPKRECLFGGRPGL